MCKTKKKEAQCGKATPAVRATNPIPLGGGGKGGGKLTGIARKTEGKP